MMIDMDLLIRILPMSISISNYHYINYLASTGLIKYCYLFNIDDVKSRFFYKQTSFLYIHMCTENRHQVGGPVTDIHISEMLFLLRVNTILYSQ